MEKRKVLVVCDWYEPGYKAGGPIQSCKNIAATLQYDIDFYILTSDRDLGETQSYKSIETNKWVKHKHNENVFYASPGYLKLPVLKKIIKDIAPDVVYFNSMFSKNYTIRPLFVLRSMKYAGKIILAPRGMLHQGAMAKKSLKKQVFLSFFQTSGIKSKIIFHATDAQEKVDILKYFKKGTRVELLENIPNTDNDNIVRKKEKGTLKMVFISRIHPKKNLDYLLKVLANIESKGRINLDVYGTHDDTQYLEQCRVFARSLPDNISVNFFEPIPHREIFPTLHKYHLFALPTLGENFGHAIFEALSSGCPVLISDQTPWRNLETVNAGWDIPLHNKSEFKTIIEDLIAMDGEEYEAKSKGALDFASNFVKNTLLKEKYFALFS